MSLWMKIKIWTKAVVLGFVLIYTIFFIAKNMTHNATFWYWFGSTWEAPLVVFAFFSFIAGVLMTLFVRTILKTIRQFKDLRVRNAAARRDRDIDDMMSKAAMLKTRDDDRTSTTGRP